jgi:hypothetical protein
MSCPALSALSSAVSAVPDLPVPTGLGAVEALEEQAAVLAAAVALLQRELAVRMAVLEQQGPPPTDVLGDAVRAGLGATQAGRLRRLGVFAADHPALQEAWLAGRVGEEQVAAVRDVAVRLATPALRATLVELLLPHLPGLDAKRARRLAHYTADQLQPGDPDEQEQSEHAARSLMWSRAPRGGIVFEGYLPTAEAAAFTAAIASLTEDLRVAGDGLSPGQRHADALAALVDRAELPGAGGLPASMTLTVSLQEAERIASRDPAVFGTRFEAREQSECRVGGAAAGDAAVRFGLCCAAITPVLHDGPPPGGLLGRIAATRIEPLAVGRAVRLATAAQRRALQLRDGGCVIPGCAISAAHTQPHHVTGWAIGGATNLDNLVSLCWVHHRQVELGRYVFVRKRPGQPPPDHALEHPRWWIRPPRPGHRD